MYGIEIGAPGLLGAQREVADQLNLSELLHHHGPNGRQEAECPLIR